MVASDHARTTPGAHRRSPPAEPLPRRGDRRAAASRQDDARARARAQMEVARRAPRPGEACGPAAPQRCVDDARTARGARRHRRDPAPARPLSAPSRARRPATQACALPDPGERLPPPPAAELGVLGGADRLPRAGRVLARGRRSGEVALALAARRLSPLLPRAKRARELRVAREPRANLPRARPPPARYDDTGLHARALLDDARALPRTDLELVGAGPFLRRRGHDGPALARRPEGHVHGARTGAVERERRQARGQVAQGLRPGQRATARPPELAVAPGSGAAPQARRLVRGLRAARGPEAPGRRPAGVLLLGHAPGRGARPPRRARAEAPGLRVQAHGRARRLAVHAHRPGGSRAVASRGGSRGGEDLSAGGEDPSGGDRAGCGRYPAARLSSRRTARRRDPEATASFRAGRRAAA